MSPAKRIFLNVAATYGRSLYVLAVGLFCGRWALMALGEVDFGLFGLVGGLTVAVAFVSNLFASAVGRFYAYAVGLEKTGRDDAKGICRKWFNTALSIHATVPLLLLLAGYPAGAWAVENFLAIPPDRIASSLWVWRFTCLSCFGGMIAVPFRAMYVAKQEIAEMTVYDILSSTIKLAVLWYMVDHAGDWLAAYAFWMMVISVLPEVCIVAGALVKYRECRFARHEFIDFGRTKELTVYAFARFWSSFSAIVSGQGLAITVNKYLGAAYNSSMTVGNQVAGQASTLGGALSNAFWPAIANKAGEGREEDVRKFSFMTCRLGSLLVILFALPLALEIDEVLRLWLKNPPPAAAMICLTVLANQVLERMTEGYWMAILSVGRGVGLYSACVSIPGMVALGTGWALAVAGMGVEGICAGMLVGHLLLVVFRLCLGRKLVAMPSRHWLKKVFLPIASVVTVSMAAGIVPRMTMEQSFMRLVATTLACEAAFLPLSWWLVLSRDERSRLLDRFRAKTGGA